LEGSELMKKRQYNYLLKTWHRLGKFYDHGEVNEAYWKQIREIVEKISSYQNCPVCGGYGKHHTLPFFVVKCERCKGSGHINTKEVS